ncbi:hypothetical protein [Leucothrix arctica]|uniref:Uncharacterized protein n=1 Tax=Leucothrix arctica TaxID=1481894 RepID=A0A317CJM5_9GAMM|nr:hypothetical protein [Leucothrix arctica]PWQ98686.1 hypothetical protein DKT75_02430 [Leucothrix arctica]
MLSVTIEGGELTLSGHGNEPCSLNIGGSTVAIESNSVTFSTDQYDFIYEDVNLTRKGQSVSIDYVFDKYRLDLNLLYDEKYLNRVLFAAPSREFKSDELFFQLIHLLRKFPRDSKFLGGLITLLSYRIGENFKLRSCYINEILLIKNDYDKSVVLLDSVSIRWYVSSCAAFSTILLLSRRTLEAKKCLQRFWRNSCYFPLSEAIGWNHALCMINLGLILYDKEKPRAVAAFTCAFDVSSNSILTVNNASNKFILFQYLDCEVLLRLSKLSIVALMALQHDSKIPERFSSIVISSKHKFTYRDILKRFVCKNKEEYHGFYLDVSILINEKIEG